MALTDSITHYWKLDESGTGNASDSVGSTTLTNTTGKTYVSALINNGIDMGSTTRNTTELTTSTDIVPAYNADFSVSLWFKQNRSCQTSVNPYLLICSSNSATGFALTMGPQWNAGSPRMDVFRRTNTDVHAYNSFANDTTTWHHLVAVFDATAGTISGYLDGSAFTTTGVSSTGSFNSSAYPRTIVGGSYMSNNAESIIDEVGFWSRVLSSGEVTTLYNGGTGLAYPFNTTSIKLFNGLAQASIKTIDGLAMASVKNFNGLV